MVWLIGSLSVMTAVCAETARTSQHWLRLPAPKFAAFELRTSAVDSIVTPRLIPNALEALRHAGSERADPLNGSVAKAVDNPSKSYCVVRRCVTYFPLRSQRLHFSFLRY
jgi:hypothetical protein